MLDAKPDPAFLVSIDKIGLSGRTVEKNKFNFRFSELNKILLDLNKLNDATGLACNNRLIARRYFDETQI